MLLPWLFILAFLGAELHIFAFVLFSGFEFFVCLWLGYEIGKKGLFGSFYSFVLLFALIGAISDSLWVFYINSPIREISQMPFVHASAIVPVIFSSLIGASLLFSLYTFSKNAQFLVDSIIKTLIFTSFLWVHSYEKTGLLLSIDDIFYLLLIFSLSVLSTIVLSVKLDALNTSFKLIFLAVFIYNLYAILVQLSQSEANWGLEPWWLENEVLLSVRYVFYALILLCAFNVAPIGFSQDKCSQVKSKVQSRNLIFLLIPAIITIASGYVNLLFLSLTLGLLLVYRILTHHISSIVKSKERLAKEQSVHQELERQIEIHKKRLDSTNANLKRLSRFDSITGVLNRKWFIISLSEMLNSKSLGERINLYSIDFTRFKIINDTYGHHIGDGALKVMADKISFIAGDESIVGRFGSDDICVATKRGLLENDLTELAELMMQTIKTPLLIDQRQVKLDAKIGIASTQISQITPTDLIAQAELALFEAKQSNSSYAYYDENMRARNWENTKINILLDVAKFDEEFSLVYQPQFDILSKRITGVEALLRWNSPLKGNIPPAKFIPIAEQSQIIIAIGSWVLKRAITQISELNERLGTRLQISVNVSPRQIENVNFTSEVLECIAQSGLEAQQLNLEITEMNWIKAEEAATSVMAALTKSKVFVSLDDFGTGFSSLEYIKKFYINKIKIAKELIDEIVLNQADRHIVRAIISMAKKMGIKTIAEGVEKQAQLEVLSELGCDELQGFIWSRPISLKALEALLRKQDA